jgi:hypothetical protein
MLTYVTGELQQVDEIIKTNPPANIDGTLDKGWLILGPEGLGVEPPRPGMYHAESPGHILWEDYRTTYRGNLVHLKKDLEATIKKITQIKKMEKLQGSFAESSSKNPVKLSAEVPTIKPEGKPSQSGASSASAGSTDSSTGEGASTESITPTDSSTGEGASTESITPTDSSTGEGASTESPQLTNSGVTAVEANNKNNQALQKQIESQQTAQAETAGTIAQSNSIQAKQLAMQAEQTQALHKLNKTLEDKQLDVTNVVAKSTNTHPINPEGITYS